MHIGEYVKRWVGWAKAGHHGTGKICGAVLVEKILPYNMKFAEVLFNLLSVNSCKTQKTTVKNLHCVLPGTGAYFSES